jgi:hypothetical protein
MKQYRVFLGSYCRISHNNTLNLIEIKEGVGDKEEDGFLIHILEKARILLEPSVARGL